MKHMYEDYEEVAQLISLDTVSSIPGSSQRQPCLIEKNGEVHPGFVLKKWGKNPPISGHLNKGN